MIGRRRVLAIAYFFPPLGGAGVQRTLKFARYLPEHGWDVTVVSTASADYPVRDESLMAEVPEGMRVVRVRDVPGLRWLRHQAEKVFDLLGLRQGLALVRWPDDMVAWGPPALWRTLREIRRERPDVIYSTSAPFTAHAVAMLASRLTGIPWVADFRDEWSSNPHVVAEGRLVARLSGWAERRLVVRAARVVTVADYFEMAPMPPGRRVTITNGVDPADLPPLAEAGTEERFRIGYVGTLYGDRDAAPVIAALRRLVERGDLDRDRVEVRVVGNVWIEVDDWPVAVLATGYVSHAEALLEMRSASVLLLYVPAGSLAPGGKLYEYLASGRPLLAVASPDNLAAQLVAEWGAGATAPPDDPGGIEAAILDLYRGWESAGLDVDPRVRERTLERFGRPRLAEQLAAVLEEARAGR